MLISVKQICMGRRSNVWYEFYMFLKMNMDRLLLYFPLPDIQQVFVGVLEVCTSSNTHY